MEEIQRKAERMIDQEVVVFPWGKNEEPNFAVLKQSQENGLLLEQIGLRPEDPIDGKEIFIGWEEIKDLSLLNPRGH